MSSNYPEGSMKGSGIDNFEFEYGDFTCENEECGKENEGAMAYGDDWGNWSVECEYCDCEYTSGSIHDGEED